MRPEVHSARKRLPGQVRQRIRRALDNLGRDPRPARSETLRLPDAVESSIRTEWEVRRMRLADWRVVYAVNETWREVAVLAIRKRPPYDYADLDELLSEL
jgi:mRNA interferase RelE/StbE